MMTPINQAEGTFFKKRSSCPLCSAEVPQTGERFAVMQMDLDMRVVECPQCGLLYKEFEPSENLIRMIYNNNYVHFSKNNRTVVQSCRERVLRMGKPTGLRHLDYGCGGGGLVCCALEMGWDSYGVDPFLPDRLLGDAEHRFIKTTAESLADTNVGRFDWISMWAVIEHLNYPLRTFQGLSRCLTAKGKIIFNAPNGDSWIARRSGDCWGIALLLEHSTFWTERAFNYVANQCGLTLVKIRKCGTPYPYGKRVPSWESFGLRTASALESVSEKRDQAHWGPFFNGISLWGQRLAQSKILGYMLRTGLMITGIGDHYYVVFQKK